MKWLGYRGGAVIFHQWSFEGGRQRYRPHFHFVAAGYIDRDRYLDRYGRRVMRGEMDSDPVREVNRRTGDVYAKISHAGSAREIYSILHYLLTHVSMRAPVHPEARRRPGPRRRGQPTQGGTPQPRTGNHLLWGIWHRACSPQRPSCRAAGMRDRT